MKVTTKAKSRSASGTTKPGAGKSSQTVAAEQSKTGGKVMAAAKAALAPGGTAAKGAVPPQGSKAPAAPVASGTTGAARPIVLVVLGLIAVLVVFEMTALLKGKVDRQRQLVSVGTFGIRGGQERPESYKGAIALKTDGQDRLFLVDSDWNKVLVYDTKTSSFVTAIDRALAQRENFAPWDVSIDPQGTIFVLDKANQEVVVFSPAYEFLRRFPAPNATALTVDKRGEVLVSDNLKMQVVRYSPDGKELKRFGAPGSSRGQLNSPYRLVTDDKGSVYVADMGNKRVVVFSAQGTFERAWNLKFTPTIVLGLAAWGKEIYINDFEGGMIWIYSPAGNLVGQISIPYPSNFALDSGGTCYLPTVDGLGRYLQNKGAAPKKK